MSAAQEVLGTTELLISIMKEIHRFREAVDPAEVDVAPYYNGGYAANCLSRKGWLNPALVCTQWHAVAMETIWAAPVSLLDLLRTFPRDLFQRVRIDNIRMDKAWVSSGLAEQSLLVCYTNINLIVFLATYQERRLGCIYLLRLQSSSVSRI